MSRSTRIAVLVRASLFLKQTAVDMETMVKACADEPERKSLRSRAADLRQTAEQIDHYFLREPTPAASRQTERNLIDLHSKEST